MRPKHQKKPIRLTASHWLSFIETRTRLAKTKLDHICFGIFVIIAVLVGTVPAQAEQVRLEFQGLDLLGQLEFADQPSFSKNGVVLLLHGTLSYADAPPIRSLQSALIERGLNTLAITLSLGLDARNKRYPCNLEHDHRNADAVAELGAWVAWLHERKAKKITLVGLGRGADQAAMYAVNAGEQNKKRQMSIVMVEPLMWTSQSAESDYLRRFNQPVRKLRQQAEKLIKDGEPFHLFAGKPFLTCEKTRVTASAFLDYYGLAEHKGTPNLLALTSKPVLIVTGRDLVEQQLLAGRDNLTFVNITSPTRRKTEGDMAMIADAITDFHLRKRKK